MEANDYVSYPLALKLKEAGFRGTALGKYVDCPNDPTLFHGMKYQSWNLDKDEILAPALWHAQKWLREKWSLHIGANPLIPSLYWAFFIDDLNQYINPQDGELMSRWTEEMQEEESNRPGYDSYESALSAGIAAALELLGKDVEK